MDIFCRTLTGKTITMFYKQGVSMLFTHCPSTAILHAGEVVGRIPPNDYGKPDRFAVVVGRNSSHNLSSM